MVDHPVPTPATSSAIADLALPPAAPRRQGPHRHDDPRRGLRRAPLRRLHAQLRPDVFTQSVACLLAQGLRASAGVGRAAGQGDRQPLQISTGEKIATTMRGARASKTATWSLHAQGHDQEDGALGVLQPARRRHHRHQPRRGRRLIAVGQALRRPEATSSSPRADGMSIRFPEADAGRWAARRPACAASRCAKGDEVVGMEILTNPSGTILTRPSAATASRGVLGRGGQGIIGKRTPSSASSTACRSCAAR
jgi:hypothetical protein